MKSKNKNNKMKFKNHQEAEEIKSMDEIREMIGDMDPDAVTSFTALPLCTVTLKGLRESGFTEPTKVQRQTLIHSLQGLDVVGEAKTGSGKTLAFVIPILELLYTKCWNQMDGLGVVVITPTRELAYQIFEVFNKVGKHHNFSLGLVIGGKDIRFEWTRIKLCNIIICTPGRFLQHMMENPDFSCDNVQMLVLDEADRCLSMGFEDTMNTILEELPKDRQTLLFSATQTRDVKTLIRAGCKNPVYCSVHENSKTGTPKTLKESYLVCEEADKIKFLWSFLKHHKKFKIMVFLSTCKQTKFIFDLFTHLRPGLTVMALHGNMHQLRRMAVYDDFCNKKKAVLFATDIAARGLDIPSVDLVLQLDCPEDATTYIHRAGRTARHTRAGEAILVVTPSQEEAMVKSLKEKNIPIENISVDPNKLQNVQLKIEFILSKYTYLKEEAERAFKSYIKNLWFMKNKDMFSITDIDLDSLARSLGLTVTPRVRFHERNVKKLESTGNKKSTEQKKEEKKKVNNLGITQDEDSEDDFLQKSESQAIEDDRNPEDILKDYSLFMNSAKESISKFEVARKMLKKKLELNKKIVFDDEGIPVSDEREVKEEEEEGEDGEVGHKGIDLSERLEFLRTQDKLDKLQNSRRVKEKHKIEKARIKALMNKNKKEDEEEEDNEEDEGEFEEDEEDEDSDLDTATNQIIDDLPDPDTIYNREDEVEEESDEETDKEVDTSFEEKSKSKHRKMNKRQKQNTSSDEIDDDALVEHKKEKTKRTFNGKRKAKEAAKASKKAKIVEENEFGSISCSEKESLALYLLQGR